MIALIVGGFLLLIPGGCAVGLLSTVMNNPNGSEAGLSLSIVALLVVVAFGGFALIRDAIGRL